MNTCVLPRHNSHVVEALEGREIEGRWDIPRSKDRLILLKPLGRGHDENLIRVTLRGLLVWRAELPETGDSWTECRFHNGVLFGNSWSSYLARIDVDSGRILSKTFTK